MDIQDALRGRRSVREYKPDNISREAIATLIEAATLAPSAMNEQPWHFTVVTDKALLNSISSKAKSHILAGADAVPDHLRKALEAPAFQIFYHAPALIVISATQSLPWVNEDCALAAENLMLAAFAQGLGTCWIGFAQRWLATDEGAAMIDLPSGYRAIAPVIVGSPMTFPDAIERRAPTIRWIP